MNNLEREKLTPHVGVNETFTFGPFILEPQARRLFRGDFEVPLGGRAFDLLVVLVRSAGEVVSKRDLLRQVWPDVIVEEGSIRFHMVSVRKALRDGSLDGTRYVENVAARGYCFVAPVTRKVAPSNFEYKKLVGEAPSLQRRKFPSLAAAAIGRDEAISEAIAALDERSCVTITGPGGIGKTTVAIEVANRLADKFSGDVAFVDLGMLHDEKLVASTVSSALSLTLHDTVTSEQISAVLGQRRALLILDCCEHVIERTATLVRDIAVGAPGVRVLTTSREPLRIQGEFVLRLPPLAFPAATEAISIDSAARCGAVQLFLERARAEGARIDLDDSSAPQIARLCRELDGIPLAIELAAGRVNAFGLGAITEQLDKQFKLMWHGRRTALPRQQTLRATLDWSYALLTPDEQQMLRRLSVFVGGASLSAATLVASRANADSGAILECLAALVDKSLMTVDATSSGTRYRLLDTTRSYAWERLVESGELLDVCRTHAALVCDFFLENRQAQISQLLVGLDLELGNARAALEWCFGEHGDTEIGCQLAGAVAPVLLQCALLSECRKWTHRALTQLSHDLRGSRLELELQAAFAQSTMFADGGIELAREAFERGLDVARQLGDLPGQMRNLSGLCMFQHRAGDYRGAVETALQAEQVAQKIGTTLARTMSDSLTSVVLHFVGDIAESDRRCRDVLRTVPPLDRRSASANVGFDHRVRAMCGRARHLWLRGESLHASQMAEAAIADAESLGHPASYCIALIWAGEVFLWSREYPRYGEAISTVSMLAAKHSLMPYQAVVDGLRGALLAGTGNYVEAERTVKKGIAAMSEVRYEMLASVFASALARAQLGQGRFQDALDTVDQAIDRVHRDGDVVRLPELLVVKARGVIGIGGTSEAEESLKLAMRIARQHGTAAWELRAAVELARLWTGVGRSSDAARLLAPLCDAMKDADAVDLAQAAVFIHDEPLT